MANFSAIWQQSAHTTHNHPLAAQQEPFKKKGANSLPKTNKQKTQKVCP